MRESHHLTAEETAAILRVSVQTVRRRAKALGGFKYPGTRRWLFPRDRITG